MGANQHVTGDHLVCLYAIAADPRQPTGRRMLAVEAIDAALDDTRGCTVDPLVADCVDQDEADRRIRPVAAYVLARHLDELGNHRGAVQLHRGLIRIERDHPSIFPQLRQDEQPC